MFDILALFTASLIVWTAFWTWLGYALGREAEQRRISQEALANYRRLHPIITLHWDGIPEIPSDILRSYSAALTDADRRDRYANHYEHEWIELCQLGAIEPTRVICVWCGIDRTEVTSENPADVLVSFGADANDPKIRELRDYCDEEVGQAEIADDAREAARIAHHYGEEGEPLELPPQPNIGGEGNPDYAGPHYESVHEQEPRFVPYEMLHDPIPGTAVHKVGDVAVAGPLPIQKGDDDDISPDREEPDVPG